MYISSILTSSIFFWTKSIQQSIKIIHNIDCVHQKDHHFSQFFMAHVLNFGIISP